MNKNKIKIEKKPYDVSVHFNGGVTELIGTKIKLKLKNLILNLI